MARSSGWAVSAALEPFLLEELDDSLQAMLLAEGPREPAGPRLLHVDQSVEIFSSTMMVFICHFEAEELQAFLGRDPVLLLADHLDCAGHPMQE